MDALASAEVSRDNHIKLLKWFLKNRDNQTVRRALEDYWKNEVASAGKSSVIYNPLWDRICTALGIPEYDVCKHAEYRLDLAVRESNLSFRAVRNMVAWRVAAVIVPLIVALGTSITLLFNWNADYSVVTADAGEPVRVELPDGSRVKVMPGSTIRHNSAKFGERRVVELTGEAYFNVERDTAHPFTVETDHLSVAVFGTDFRVNAPEGEDRGTVELHYGSVQVTAGDQSVVMSPGERLHYDRTTSDMALSSMPLTELVYDRMPGLVFNNSSLAEIFAVIKKDYGVNIEVMAGVPVDSREFVADLTDARTMDNLMRILAMVSGQFSYEMTDNKIIVKNK